MEGEEEEKQKNILALINIEELKNWKKKISKYFEMKEILLNISTSKKKICWKNLRKKTNFFYEIKWSCKRE